MSLENRIKEEHTKKGFCNIKKYGCFFMISQISHFLRIEQG